MEAFLTFVGLTLSSTRKTKSPDFTFNLLALFTLGKVGMHWALDFLRFTFL